GWLALLAPSLALLAPTAAHAVGTDPVLRWNEVALEAVAQDHSGTFGPPEQGGPTRTSRALAIVHAAIHDAVSAIDGSYEPYLAHLQAPRHASLDAAVAQAAHDTLAGLYPAQRDVFAAALAGDPAPPAPPDRRHTGADAGPPP